MSLATRCTACGTIFRVVQDQLRVSEGWVRCGRCAEVFDAREQLFDLDREAPPPWPPVSPESLIAPAPAHAPASGLVRHEAGSVPRSASPAMMPGASPLPPARPSQPPPPAHAPVSPPSPRMAASQASAPPGAAGGHGASAAGQASGENSFVRPGGDPASGYGLATGRGDGLRPKTAEPGATDRPGSRREPFWEPPPAPSAPPDAPEDLPEPKGMSFEPHPPPGAPSMPERLAPDATPSDSRVQATVASEPSFRQDLGPDVVLSARLQAAQAETPARAEPLVGSSLRTPGFLRRAEGEARWQRPGVRLALSLGSLLLLLGAAAQLVWHYRDALATQSPLARQWLGGACAQLGCELQAWRRLDAFSVESTGLSEAASGNHYKFSLSLRNKSPWDLATPWVELSLNDGNGKLLMKRALKPEDFSNGRSSMAANSEQSLQLVFSTGRQRVNGYTVEIFYP